jgi:hypothetical protein
MEGGRVLKIADLRSRISSEFGVSNFADIEMPFEHLLKSA